MSVGCFLRVFTSIVDTVPLPLLVTKAVLPFGVTSTANGREPTVMSVGLFVLVCTSIVDTESPPETGPPANIGDKDGLAVRRHRQPRQDEVGVRADGDVGRVLGPGLHVNRRHCAALSVTDKDGLAI